MDPQARPGPEVGLGWLTGHLSHYPKEASPVLGQGSAGPSGLSVPIPKGRSLWQREVRTLLEAS